MEYLPVHNHLFVAYVTPKTFAENLDLIFAYGKNLFNSLIFSRVFLHTTRVRQRFAMRPQFLQNARPQDESIQLVPRVSKMKTFGT